MRFLLNLLLCLFLVATPAAALEIEAPRVPNAGAEWMPENDTNLADGLGELVHKVVSAIRPDLTEAAKVSMGVIAAVMMVALMQGLSSTVKTAADTAGTVAVASILLLNTNSMIRLGADTVREITEYGKLLLPVMTAAMAAQGGVTASAAIYAGAAGFIAILSSLIGNLLVPGIYLFLALSAGSSATGEALLKKVAELLKSLMTWVLKTLLMIFTTYLGLTGVVSGTTDAAALKAAKVTMSSFVPVVGGILSDASEAVLVSAGVLKNAAGVYGIFAVLALFLYPFLQIGTHYLILKLTAAVCAVFGGKRMTDTIETFSTAMGFLLGMTGAACVMVLVSTVCFMRGVG